MTATRAGVASGIVAVAAALGFVALYWVALGTDLGLRLDDQAVVLSTERGAFPEVYEAIELAMRVIGLISLAIVGGSTVALGFLLGRPAEAIAAGVTIAAANVATQVLKPLLGALDPLGGDATREFAAAFPSGHATVAMSLGLGLVIVAPAAMRPLAALAAWGTAVAVGLSLVALGWHYPSDVAGGYLVAATCAGLSAAAVASRASRGRGNGRNGRAAVAAVCLLLSFGLGAATVVAVSRMPEILYFGAMHTSSFVAAGVLGGLAFALVGAVAVSIGRAPRR